MDYSGYPTPIVISNLEVEKTQNIQLKFRAIIRAFGVILKYCSLILISDYIRLRQKKNNFQSKEIDRLLAEKIARPSLGHWNNFIREILKEFKNKQNQLFIPEFYDFYFSKGNFSRQIIDELIFIRNKYVHPDIFPQEEEALNLFQEYRLKLNNLLYELSFLKKYHLVKFMFKENIEELCMGSNVKISKIYQKNAYFLKRFNNDSVNKLELGNFIYSYNNEYITKDYPVLLYESLKGKTIKYILGNYSILARDDENKNFSPLSELNSLIDLLSVEIDKDLRIWKISDNLNKELLKGHINWQTFQSISENISNKIYDRLIQEEKFSYRLFLNRRSIDNDISNYLKSNKQGFILVSDSGLGKTNSLCFWERKLLKEKHSVFFFYGRDYEGEKIENLITRNLSVEGKSTNLKAKTSFLELLNLLAKSEEVEKEQKKIIILFDAINEYAAPEKLFKNITNFIAQIQKYRWVKVIFSVRTFTWENLQRQYLFNKEIYYYSKTEEPFVKLNNFSIEELKEVFTYYQNYFKIKSGFNNLDSTSKILLSNPLMLRMASIVYEGKEFPRKIFSLKIFEQYKKEKINERDYFFLDYLAEAMILLKKDEITYNDFNEKNTTKLNVNSIINNEILSKKITEYVFAEPVYENQTTPICINSSCREYGITFTNETCNLKNTCPNCGKKLGTMSIDLRSTYHRLQSEHVIQEQFKRQDYYIYFAYDRMFEFFIGKLYKRYYFKEFNLKGGEVLCNIIEEIENNFIFWGSIKNVILEFLKEDKLDSPFWFDVIHYEVGNRRSSLNYAYKQVIASSLYDYYNEESEKVLDLLKYINAPERITKNTIDISLKVVSKIISESKDITLKSFEIELLKKGLSFSDEEIIAETSRLISTLIPSNESLVLEVVSELKDKIAYYLTFSKLPLLLLPKHRNIFFNSLEGFIRTFLFLLGTNYSNNPLRINLSQIGGQLLDNNLFFVFRKLSISFVPKKIAKVYWEKHLPVNGIEIHLNQINHNKEVLNLVGFLFIDAETKRLLDYKKQLFRYCQIENGLISWCLYSLIPVYGQLNNQSEEVIGFIEELFFKGNHISKYIAHQSLKVLVSYSKIKHEDKYNINTTFEKLSKKYMEIYGGFITLTHKTHFDKTLNKYLNQKDIQGNPVVYWAKVSGDSLSLTYDNSIITNYSLYLIENKKSSKFDYLIHLLDSQYRNNKQFLFYSIKKMGEVGLHNPLFALNTILNILEKNTIKNKALIQFEGKNQCIEDVTSDALLSIKRFFPAEVTYFINTTLGKKHKNIIERVRLTEVEKGTDYMYSHYGESIYQNTFLNDKELRDFLGESIIELQNAKDVDEYFRLLVKQAFYWFEQ